MKVQDTVLRADGTNVEVVPRNARKGYTLEELYALTSSQYIEIVRCRVPGAILVCDEEGVLNSRPLNRAASELAGQPIVGDVLLCASSRVK